MEWRLRVLFNSRPAVAIQMLGSGARASMVKCDNESIEFEQHRVDGDEYESANDCDDSSGDDDDYGDS